MSISNATSRKIRDSKVWKIPFLEEEKKFLDRYAVETQRSIRELVDEALNLSIADDDFISHLEEFVLAYPGSKRFSVRVDSELFDDALFKAEDLFNTGLGASINSSTLLSTLVWNFIDKEIDDSEFSEYVELRSKQLRVSIPHSDKSLS